MDYSHPQPSWEDFPVPYPSTFESSFDSPSTPSFTSPGYSFSSSPTPGPMTPGDLDYVQYGYEPTAPSTPMIRKVHNNAYLSGPSTPNSAYNYKYSSTGPSSASFTPTEEVKAHMVETCYQPSYAAAHSAYSSGCHGALPYRHPMLGQGSFGQHASPIFFTSTVRPSLTQSFYTPTPILPSQRVFASHPSYETAVPGYHAYGVAPANVSSLQLDDSPVLNSNIMSDTMLFEEQSSDLSAYDTDWDPVSHTRSTASSPSSSFGPVRSTTQRSRRQLKTEASRKQPMKVPTKSAAKGKIFCPDCIRAPFSRQEHFKRHWETNHSGKAFYPCPLSCGSNGYNFCTIMKTVNTRGSNEGNTARPKATGIGRPDNLNQHVATHLEDKQVTKNTVVHPAFLAFLVRKYYCENNEWKLKSDTILKNVRKNCEKKMPKKNFMFGTPNREACLLHPDWAEFVSENSEFGSIETTPPPASFYLGDYKVKSETTTPPASFYLGDYKFKSRL